MPHNLNQTTGIQPVIGGWDGQGPPDMGTIGGNKSELAHRSDSRFGAWWDRHASEYTSYTKRTGHELNAAWDDWVALQETYGGHMSNIQEQMERLDPLTHTGYYAPQQEFKIELARSGAQDVMQEGQRSMAYRKGSKTLEGSGYLEQLNESLMEGYENTIAAESYDTMAWARGEVGAAEEIMSGLQEQLIGFQTHLI